MRRQFLRVVVDFEWAEVQRSHFLSDMYHPFVIPSRFGVDKLCDIL